jgi:hypothetical protein
MLGWGIFSRTRIFAVLVTFAPFIKDAIDSPSPPVHVRRLLENRFFGREFGLHRHE